MERRFFLEKDELKIPVKVTETDFGSPSRIVLGVHGLGGSSEDAIQLSLAEEMSFFSSHTIQFDFPAHGQNPCEAFTLDQCLRSLMAVVTYAREAYPEVEDLCIFASGFGAYVTLVVLEDLVDLPGNIKLVVQTPSVVMHETILAMKQLSRETLWAMDHVTFNASRPFEVTYSFYDELTHHIALVTQPIPMLILHGEEDSYIRMEHIRQFHLINPDSKLVIVPGTSHRFLEDGAWDMVLDLTRDWFEFEQVLLTDCF